MSEAAGSSSSAMDASNQLHEDFEALDDLIMTWLRNHAKPPHSVFLHIMPVDSKNGNSEVLELRVNPSPLCGLTCSSKVGGNFLARSLGAMCSRLRVDTTSNAIRVTLDTEGQMPAVDELDSAAAQTSAMDDTETPTGSPEPAAQVAAAAVPADPLAAMELLHRHQPWWDTVSLLQTQKITQERAKLGHQRSVRDLCMLLQQQKAFPKPQEFYQDYYEPLFDREQVHNGLHISQLVIACQSALLQFVGMLPLDATEHGQVLSFVQTPPGFRKPDPAQLNCFYFSLLASMTPASWHLEAVHHIALSNGHVFTWKTMQLALRPSGELMAAKQTLDDKESSFYEGLKGVANDRNTFICGYKDYIVLRAEAPKMNLLLLELCWPTLELLLEKNNALLNSAWCAMLTRQLLTALNFLFAQPNLRALIHRDVKPSNLMFKLRPHDVSAHSSHTSNTHDFAKLRWADELRLVDFSAARITNAGEAAMGTDVGSDGWRAPEQCGGGRHTPKIDVFAAGLTMYLILYRTHAFQGQTEAARQKMIQLNRRHSAPEKLRSPMLFNLLNKMLQHQADQRPSIAECLSHAAAWEPSELELFVKVMSVAIEPDAYGNIPCPQLRNVLCTWGEKDFFPRVISKPGWKAAFPSKPVMAQSAEEFAAYSAAQRNSTTRALQQWPLLLTKSYASQSDDMCGLMTCMRNYCVHFSEMQDVAKIHLVTAPSWTHGELFMHVDVNLPLLFVDMLGFLRTGTYSAATIDTLKNIANANGAANTNVSKLLDALQRYP